MSSHCTYFCSICLNEVSKRQEVTWNDSIIVTTAQIHPASMLILLMTGIYKLRRLTSSVKHFTPISQKSAS